MSIPQTASSSREDSHQEVFTFSRSYTLLGEDSTDIYQDAKTSFNEPVPEEPDASKRRFLHHDRTSNILLYQAALKGDWQVAKDLFEEHSDVFGRRITEGNETALHIAVGAEHTDFVKELVGHMSEDEVGFHNTDENTALCFAAGSEIVLIAKMLVEKNKKLPSIRGIGGKTPLYIAALNGRRKMVSYLYGVTSIEELQPVERIDILVVTISAEMYDIALTILKKDRTLATMETSNETIALEVLARKPFAIGSKSQLSDWERRLNNSWFKWMCNKALMQTSAHELVKLLWKGALELPIKNFATLLDKHSSLMFKAAKYGNVEYLIILIRSYPDLIWRVDKKNRSIFHIATKYRQESVFKLIHEIGALKFLISQYVDTDGNNMLHLVGPLPPPDRLNVISGAALQMQRELLWFKEIQKIVPPIYKKMANNDSNNDNVDKPWELFRKKHQGLKVQGEKWMKDTSKNCMLVATLIATVVFAAAFTVPGGNNQEIGTPIFLKSKWFMVFFISNVLAFVASSTSILTFLSILTSRYTENDFLMSLPARLLFGLTTLFISIASMVVAFGATWFLVYCKEMSWIPMVIIASVGVPVTLFVVLHCHLWFDIICSTFWSRFLFRPGKNRLFNNDFKKELNKRQL